MQPWFPLPAGVSALAESTPGTVLLETAKPAADPPLSRLFLFPYKTLAPRSAEELAALFAEIDATVAQQRYAAGYFAYECGAALEPAAGPMRAEDEPLAWFGFYDRCFVFDHRAGRFVGDVPPGLQRIAPGDEAAHVETGLVPDAEAFAHAIQAIHRWIADGDIYQLNYTWPLALQTESRPAALYRELVARQPVPYAALVHCAPGNHVLSLSPELFFCIETDGDARQIRTMPMKGTAARGRTTAEDRAAAEGLRTSEKNRAENVMIVDLLRNDLGRLCTFGSVRAEDLFAVERHPTLWQMTSTVSGTLRADVRTKDLMRALFPSGSVTGAPKVRAMQLIARLEQRRRGVYTGAIGYFSAERSVFSVAIRTLEMRGGAGAMGVGSGIVIDSSADDELREGVLKAEFLVRAAEEREPLRLIETLLWRDGFPLLDLHLDRLEDSADYFGFACERAAVQAALESAASKLTGRSAHRVRLLLNALGEIEISYAPLGETGDAPMRVTISAERTDPRDRFLFHKTTHRRRYAGAFAQAQRDGFADALFFNTRGELTEGAISNVFVELNGCLVTPPLACGLLPGVFRRHLLETRPEIIEAVVTRDDLQRASGLWLANAVRGLRRAVLVGL